MRTDLACIDASWPGLRHEFVLDIIAELGFSAVDIALWNDYTALTPDIVRTDPAAWAGRATERLESRGLTVSDVFPVPTMEIAPQSINHPDPAEREASEAIFDDMLTFARHVGTRHMTVLPGVLHEGQTYEEALRGSAAGLRTRVERAAEHGITLAIEGHVGSHVDTPEKILQLLELTPGLTLTLDFGHFAVQGIPDEEVYPLLEHTSHFHVRGCREGFVQTRFVENAINFDAIIPRLNDAGYEGWLTVEYVHDDRPGCSECDNIQEVVLFRDYLRARLGETAATSNRI